MSDTHLLLVMRISVFVFGLIVLAFALNSTSSIFEMVEEAYEITLAAAFVPLAFGLYWQRASTQGAVASIVVGVLVWLLASHVWVSDIWPPQLLGLVFGAMAMVLGSLLPQWVPHKPLLRDGVVHPHH